MFDKRIIEILQSSINYSLSIAQETKKFEDYTITKDLFKIIVLRNIPFKEIKNSNNITEIRLLNCEPNKNFNVPDNSYFLSLDGLLENFKLEIDRENSIKELEKKNTTKKSKRGNKKEKTISKLNNVDNKIDNKSLFSLLGKEFLKGQKIIHYITRQEGTVTNCRYDKKRDKIVLCFRQKDEFKSGTYWNYTSCEILFKDKIIPVTEYINIILSERTV
jgi:hypothetical protein